MKTLELTLLYLTRNDEVLLAMKKRGFGMGKWNGVGGKIDTGETIEEAMIRECFEEIGVRVTKFQKVGFMVYDEIHLDERKKMNIHVFTSTEWEGEITESEEMMPQWFRKDEIPFISMWEADKDWLPVILDGNLLESEFTLDDKDRVLEKKIKIVESLSR